MELHLEVYDPNPRLFTLASGAEIKQISVQSYYKDGEKSLPTFAKAKLVGDFRCDCEYWLHVGNDPDVIATADGSKATDNNARTIEFKKKGEEKILLFQQTMGRTCLRLREMAYNEDGDKQCVREVLCCPVYVNPSAKKKEWYKKMVKELMDMPQFFLDDLKGQMQLNGYSLEWNDGFSSYNDASLELDAVRTVLEELREPLQSICRAPKSFITRKKRLVDIERARHCGSCSDRKIERSGEHGVDCSRLMLDVKQVSYAVRAHSVIRHFFQRLLKRCDDIILAFSHELSRISRELKELKSLYHDDLKDPAFKGRSYALDCERMTVRKKQELAKQTRRMVVDFSGRSIFRDANRRLTIFDVSPTAFTGGVGYEHAYNIILTFERSHFWWIGQESNFYKIPRLSFSNDENSCSRWERKYSMVYEFWCYHRLIKAMQERGCKYVPENEDRLSARNGSSCVFEYGNLRIKIVHGFSAKLGQQGHPDVEFYLDPKSNYGKNEDINKENARERTPDFAIIFSNTLTNETKWIVADSKSQEEMNYNQIVKPRERYLKFVKYRGLDAAQSWIFYAGEREPGGCGVECPPLCSEKVEDPLAGDPRYSFSATEGIIRKPGSDIPRGHVRANIKSLGADENSPADNSPFEDFITGEIATMVRALL